MTTEVTFYGQNYETDEWYDIDYDSFISEVHDEFSKYIGNETNIISNNYGWNNASVSTDFILEDADDIVRKLSHDSQWNMTIEKLPNVLDTYHIIVDDHDGTSNFMVSFKERNEL